MLNYQRVFDVLMVEGMGLNLHTDHWISSIPQQNLAVSVIPSQSLFNGVGAFQVETTRSQLQLPVTIFHQTDQRAPSNKHEKNVFLPETLWQMIKLYYTIWYYIIYIYILLLYYSYWQPPVLANHRSKRAILLLPDFHTSPTDRSCPGKSWRRPRHLCSSINKVGNTAMITVLYLFIEYHW